MPLMLQKSLKHGVKSSPLWILAATLLGVIGLPASAETIAPDRPALNASAIAFSDPSGSVASLWPSPHPGKRRLFKELSNGSGLPHTSTVLTIEGTAFAAESPELTERTAVDELVNVPSLDTALSTEAEDLSWVTPAVAIDEADLLPPTEPVEKLAQAEDSGGGGDLAAASQNPIADLISVPFQNNTNFGVGPYDRTQNILNIQPVYPTPLSEDLLLVTRTIVPIVTQPDINGGNHIWGLGDINPTFFFVPVSESNVTWGVGPTFLLPTATDTQTGTGKWSVGPAGVVVANSGPWVFGGLLSQIWSIAGDGDRADVSQLIAQPFVNYNLPNGWYLSSSPLINVNWNADDEQLTLPIGGGFGRVFNIGRQPVNASAQVYWNAIAPEGAGDLSLRLSLALLFPQ